MSQGRRLPRSAACAVLMLCLLAIHVTRAQEIRATEKPFLWLIEGPVPNYLYGTIHVPDARVLALPDVVRQAFEASDAFYAELPIDEATMQQAEAGMQLPAGQTLRSLVGDAEFARLVKLTVAFLPDGTPPIFATQIAAQLQSMKPWAALMAAQDLLFVDDLRAGRQSLDETLYGMAAKNGKTVGGLETVQEQFAVFDVFSREEQVRLFAAELNQIEMEGVEGTKKSLQEAIDLYLAGDLEHLIAEMRKHEPAGDSELTERLMVRLEDDRNVRMAERIAELSARTPPRSHFFAIGAAHFAADGGVITLLTKKGFKIRRLGPADAAAIVRKPAA